MLCYNKIKFSAHRQLGGIILKALRKWVDKFCYKHPHFGIPNLMKYFIIISALVYLVGMMDTTYTFYSYLVFEPHLILRGQIWRLITWIFIPTNSFPWIIVELYFYYFLGNTLEGVLGSGRFTVYYLMGIILNIIYALVFMLVTNTSAFITSMYLNLSLFFAYAVMFPDNRVLLFFIIPIKVKWLAIVDAAFMVINMLSSIASGNLIVAFLPLVAILNFFIFFGDYFSSARHSTPFGNFNNNTVNFKSAARKYKKQQSTAKSDSGTSYRHKCAVCGRTDAEHPELEFRYCSRCAGYHCFCMDHINNHIHFTE